MLVLLASLSFAADEPCYGHTFENQLEGTNFWVEWKGTVLTETEAANVLDAAEKARSTYINSLNMGFTDEAVVIAFNDTTLNAANATTKNCESGPVPHVQLWPGHVGPHIRATTAHELGHVSQYSYVGAYTNAVDSWTWWLEGTAVWFAMKAEGDDMSDWIWAVEGHLDNPQMTLMQGVAAYWDDEQSAHMYGSVIVAQHLEEYAGVEAIRETWEYAGTQGGERIMWPDAIAALGLDFNEYWADFLAHAVVVDMENGALIEQGVDTTGTAYDLPYSGTSDEIQRLGWQPVRVSQCLNQRTDTIDVAFEGDPEATWTAVLVVTSGADPGDEVVDYIVLDVDENGLASGSFEGLGAGEYGWLVASPFDDEPGAFAFSWDMTSPDGEVSCSGEDTDDDGQWTQPPPPEPEGCGCDAVGSGAAGWLAVLALLGLRRRSV